jgi:hypothetical protein
MSEIAMFNEADPPDAGVQETALRSLDTRRVPSCFLYEVAASDMEGAGRRDK